MTLSTLIKEYRKEHDISQRQFAVACGLSNGYISMLEKGINPKTKQPLEPTIPALKKIAEAMGMNLGDLLLAVDDMSVTVWNTITNEQKKELSALMIEGGLGDDLDIELMLLMIQLSPDQKQLLLSQLKAWTGQIQ